MRWCLCFLLWGVLVGLVDAQTLTSTPPGGTGTPAPLTWCYKFDFRVSNGGWTTFPLHAANYHTGTWVSGDGWRYTDQGGFRGIGIFYDGANTSASLNRMDLEWSYMQGHHTSANATSLTHRPLRATVSGSSNGNLIPIAWDDPTPSTVTYQHQPFNSGIGWTNGQVYLRSTASSDDVNPITYSGSVTFHSIEMSGYGVSPFPTSNCGSFMPTSTPTATLTSTVTITAMPTFPPNWLILCPQAPVDPLSVSGGYQSQCQPCLDAEWGTPQPYEGEGTVTATQTPLGYQTPTDVPRMGTYVPTATDAIETPSPETIQCAFQADCEFVSVISGNTTPDGIEAVDIDASLTGYEGEFWRAVQLTFILTKSNGTVLPVYGITLHFDADVTGLPDNIVVQQLSQTGTLLTSETYNISDGDSQEFTIGSMNTDYIETPIYYVTVSLIADVKMDIGDLLGSALVYLVEMTYLPSGDGDSLFDAAPVDCTSPGSYPSTIAFGIEGFGYSHTTCHTIIPYVDLSALQGAIETFFPNVGGNLHIPRIQVCFDWYFVPTITFLGIVVPITMLINAMILIRMISWVLKF